LVKVNAESAIIAENAVGIGKMIIANNPKYWALATPQAIATSGASAVPVIAVNNISTGSGHHSSQQRKPLAAHENKDTDNSLSR
jgi:hypothetical protein